MGPQFSIPESSQNPTASNNIGGGNSELDEFEARLAALKKFWSLQIINNIKF